MSNPQPRLKKRPMNGRDRLDELGGNLTSRNFSTHLCPHKPTKFRFRLLSCLFPNFSFGQLSVRRIVLWGNFFVCFLLRSENKSSKPQNLLFVEEGGVGGECGPVGKAKRGRGGVCVKLKFVTHPPTRPSHQSHNIKSVIYDWWRKRVRVVVDFSLL